MTEPARLIPDPDYYEAGTETYDGIEVDIVVLTCPVEGCKWSHDGAGWSDLSDDHRDWANARFAYVKHYKDEHLTVADFPWLSRPMSSIPGEVRKGEGIIVLDFGETIG